MSELRPRIDPEQFKSNEYSLVFFRDDSAHINWLKRARTDADAILAEQFAKRGRYTVHKVLGAITGWTLDDPAQRVNGLHYSYINKEDNGAPKPVQLYPQGYTVYDHSILRDPSNPLLGPRGGIQGFGPKSAEEFADFADAMTQGQYLPPQFHTKPNDNLSPSS